MPREVKEALTTSDSIRYDDTFDLKPMMRFWLEKQPETLEEVRERAMVMLRISTVARSGM